MTFSIESYTIRNRDAYLRAMDEEKLREYLLEDIKDASKDIVDWKKRKEIRHLCTRLSNEE
jgi:hypothetical protein